MIGLLEVRFYPGTKSCVCPAHTDVTTHTHAHSLKRKEDKGRWRPWLAASFVEIQLSHRHMHANKLCGPRITAAELDGKENKR